MVYFAAGISGITGIVGTFFVKEYLGLSAAFLAGLGFWAGLPWALKMPLGHLVDIIWRWKAILVYVGASLIAASLTIMYGLVVSPDMMAQIMPVEAWYVVSVLLSPCGYVIQDAVADAMSVEAVPKVDADGTPISPERDKALHTTMQTLGRIALFVGLIAVSLLNIFMFDGIENKTDAEKATIYGQIYLSAMIIPLVSISGVLLASVLKQRQRRQLKEQGRTAQEIDDLIDRPGEETKPNFWYFGGGLAFVFLSLSVGLSDIPFSKEIIFAASMAIIVFMMRILARELDPLKARALFGTAIIIFIFRAVPGPGPGVSWFEIDVLKFDQQFLSVLALITAMLTLLGMIVLRPLMSSKSIAYIVVLLTILGGILALPTIGLYYGIHHVTEAATNGIVDARFIAILNTAIESPLGQIAMIPMLAWIARNAPNNLKATFFAVMASFTNLALSASNLLTTYVNQIFVVTREVKNRETGIIETAANYDALGMLLIVVLLVAVAAPLLAILIIQRSPLKTFD